MANHSTMYCNFPRYLIKLFKVQTYLKFPNKNHQRIKSPEHHQFFSTFSPGYKFLILLAVESQDFNRSK
jgi:hypothetical protein